MNVKKRADWILRFVKGIFIGSGFILPGVSGGALAAVFGIYERLISFFSNITKDFKKNVIFFIPVGLGACAGIFAFSFVVSYMLGNAATYSTWFFIGCVVGMVPALARQSGRKGRKPMHVALMLVVTALAYFLLRLLANTQFANLPQNIFTWLLAGGIIGLGVIVPGLSPSNLLLYMNLYEPMSDGIKGLNFGVIVPLFVGVFACVVLLSKLMEYIFSKAYATLYHIILGVVFASTLVIVPFDFNYLSVGGLISLGACFAGAALAYGMSKLDDKYKPEE
jgi:putative membrane protein